ncbi:succinylglutamate desuccinylase [Marinomonas piezotolerans]|uniref:Succinylglutamate desuccinylase n=1 Tax=Marinomonas piezotolerans TaxID=2213058 RepID=A0A370UA12_9GAMM|nr:succinylglutamate desuccinylase [Marinomonas piezotolerans]RDL44593.1 succinylglutamate desuccinylase [Marinomonas piezotolerans]
MATIIDDFLSFTLSNPHSVSQQTHKLSCGTVILEAAGILRFEPDSQAKASVVLSAGIHGNETAPIELLNDLVKQLFRGELNLAVRLLIIFGHPEAMIAGKRFIDVNLNRLFCGAWERYEGIEVTRAQNLEQAVSEFFSKHQGGQKLHYDLHTAIRGSQYQKFAIHPFTGGRAYNIAQFRWYAALGVEAVLLSHQPTTTFSYHSYVNHGAEAVTIELGKVRPFGGNDLSTLARAAESLTSLIEKGSLRQADMEAIQGFAVIDVLEKDAEDYELNIDHDVKNFTEFEAGFELAKSSHSRYIVKQSNDAIVFPNTDIPVGQRAGLVVRRIALNKL